MNQVRTSGNQSLQMVIASIPQWIRQFRNHAGNSRYSREGMTDLVIASKPVGIDDKSRLEAKKSFNLTKIGEEIAKLSDNDADYIISTCLQTVEYRDEEHERDFPIWHRTGGLAYEWIELPDMLTLTWSVILYNLGGFIPAVPSNTKRLGAA